jgi:pSer/pThr/pTyr-binding forkhead associated (FHA) protein
VRKREGNPFPERISVGRAKNCDVVLRFPSISKLHAHFLSPIPGGQPFIRLADAGSANGTFLGDRQLKQGENTSVKVGDKIRFGALDLEYVDAASFFAQLS